MNEVKLLTGSELDAAEKRAQEASDKLQNMVGSCEEIAATRNAIDTHLRAYATIRELWRRLKSTKEDVYKITAVRNSVIAERDALAERLDRLRKHIEDAKTKSTACIRKHDPYGKSTEESIIAQYGADDAYDEVLSEMDRLEGKTDEPQAGGK